MNHFAFFLLFLSKKACRLNICFLFLVSFLKQFIITIKYTTVYTSWTLRPKRGRIKRAILLIGSLALECCILKQLLKAQLNRGIRARGKINVSRIALDQEREITTGKLGTAGKSIRNRLIPLGFLPSIFALYKL